MMGYWHGVLKHLLIWCGEWIRVGRDERSGRWESNEISEAGNLIILISTLGDNVYVHSVARNSLQTLSAIAVLLLSPT